MKNYCPKCRYFFGTIKSGKCPDCDVPLENAPQDPSVPQYRAPWRTNRDPKDRPGVYDAEGNAVADCDRSVMLSDSDKRRNAELIADAPTLLAERNEARKIAEIWREYANWRSSPRPDPVVFPWESDHGSRHNAKSDAPT